MTTQPDDLSEALRPIASLISKSEKAQQRLAPGTWQHTMLQGKLTALRLASALMNNESTRHAAPTREELQAVLPAFASMISKTEQAQGKFPAGTSQHTLLRNRLHALRLAETLIKDRAAHEKPLH